MSSIYIVKGEHGQWSDHSEWTICCYHSEDKASKVVEKLRALQVYNTEYNQREYAEFEVPYREAHAQEVAPCHPEVPEGFRELQQACSHGKGTPVMKDEYRRLQKLHIQNVEAAKAAYAEFDKRRNEYEDLLDGERNLWLIKNYKPEFSLLEVSPFIRANRGYRGMFPTDISYSYYEAELR